MATLEDSILKKNIPGRYTSWTDENNDKRRNNDNDDDGNHNNHDTRPGNNNDVSDSEDDEYYFQGLPTTTTTNAASSSSQQQQQQRSSGNTGVKGVLADHREHQQREMLRKEEERLETLRILHRATHPAVRKEECCASGGKSDDKIKNTNNDSDDDDDSDSDLDDSDDDEFLKQFRNQRLAQLQLQSITTTTPTIGITTTTTTNNTPPTYGSLATLTPDEYVDLIDTLHPQTHLIVHLYESTITACRMLHSTLEKVAQCMPHAKFIEVRALDANPKLDTICLPAVLIYRGGELVHNLVRFTEELPKNGSGGGYGVEDVREVLERLGVVE